MTASSSALWITITERFSTLISNLTLPLAFLFVGAIVMILLAVFLKGWGNIFK